MRKILLWKRRKRGKCSEKESIFCGDDDKRRTEASIWRHKMFYLWRKKKRKHLEKEIIFAEEKKREKENEANIMEKKKLLWTDQQPSTHNDIYI